VHKRKREEGVIGKGARARTDLFRGDLGAAIHMVQR
jgi:hypothetical protein